MASLPSISPTTMANLLEEVRGEFRREQDGSVRLLSHVHLGDGDKREILSQVMGWEDSPRGKEEVVAFGGRGAIGSFLRSDGSSGVIRKFYRGGWARYLSSDLFCVPLFSRNPLLRPEREFEILVFLQRAGARVPTPLASVVRFHYGKLCYRGFLATARIIDTTNALTWFGREQNRALEITGQIAERAGAAAGQILRLGVLHADLHPGNILVGADSGVWLIDFDKAEYLRDPKDVESGVTRLHQRWCRSMRRLGCPALLEEAFLRGIRSIHGVG